MTFASCWRTHARFLHSMCTPREYRFRSTSVRSRMIRSSPLRRCLRRSGDVVCQSKSRCSISASLPAWVTSTRPKRCGEEESIRALRRRRWTWRRYVVCSPQSAPFLRAPLADVTRTVRGRDWMSTVVPAASVAAVAARSHASFSRAGPLTSVRAVKVAGVVQPSVERLDRGTLEISSLRYRENLRMIERLAAQLDEGKTSRRIGGGRAEHLEEQRHR